MDWKRIGKRPLVLVCWTMGRGKSEPIFDITASKGASCCLWGWVDCQCVPGLVMRSWRLSKIVCACHVLVVPYRCQAVDRPPHARKMSAEIFVLTITCGPSSSRTHSFFLYSASRNNIAPPTLLYPRSYTYLSQPISILSLRVHPNPIKLTPTSTLILVSLLLKHYYIT